mmetsp:Transcript_19940/g.22066  ORF Transcript_19940/g.22066 Transcript_19940/m.22066 type:complete len:99 (-) Transcript_19940:15-311(-)
MPVPPPVTIAIFPWKISFRKQLFQFEGNVFSALWTGVWAMVVIRLSFHNYFLVLLTKCIYRSQRSTACSSAIQCINIPINSRSDIDIRPVGFVEKHSR